MEERSPRTAGGRAVAAMLVVVVVVAGGLEERPVVVSGVEDVGSEEAGGCGSVWAGTSVDVEGCGAGLGANFESARPFPLAAAGAPRGAGAPPRPPRPLPRCKGGPVMSCVPGGFGLGC